MAAVSVTSTVSALALSPDEWPDLTPGLVAVAGETVWEAGATFARHFESRRTHT